MNLTLEDIMICTRTVYGEARGEPYSGMLAVAAVMVNRWLSTTGQWKRDDTLASACLRHQQFSVWNAGDANFKKITDVGVQSAKFRECMSVVLVALAGVDPTRGARHYVTTAKPSWARTWPPSWTAGARSSIEFGSQTFYVGIA